MSLLVAVTACKQTPTESLQVTFTAAEDGDFDDFVDGFTRRSGNVLRGLAALADRGHEAFAFGAFSETPTIVGERRVKEYAVVQVTDGDVSLPVPMVEERGRWRVDLHAAEELWYRYGGGPFAPRLLEPEGFMGIPRPYDSGEVPAPAGD